MPHPPPRRFLPALVLCWLAASVGTIPSAGAALYNAIKRPVVLNADQTPQYSDIRRAGHEGGDFLFVRKGR